VFLWRLNARISAATKKCPEHLIPILFMQKFDVLKEMLGFYFMQIIVHVVEYNFSWKIVSEIISWWNLNFWDENGTRLIGEFLEVQGACEGKTRTFPRIASRKSDLPLESFFDKIRS
jgi:hypothetical protein